MKHILDLVNLAMMQLSQPQLTTLTGGAYIHDVSRKWASMIYGSLISRLHPAFAIKKLELQYSADRLGYRLPDDFELMAHPEGDTDEYELKNGYITGLGESLTYIITYYSNNTDYIGYASNEFHALYSYALAAALSNPIAKDYKMQIRLDKKAEQLIKSFKNSNATSVRPYRMSKKIHGGSSWVG